MCARKSIVGKIRKWRGGNREREKKGEERERVRRISCSCVKRRRNKLIIMIKSVDCRANPTLMSCHA